MEKKQSNQPKSTSANNQEKTNETKSVIDKMVAALNNHEIDTMHTYFHESFNWIGNQGCGLKKGLKAFQNGWQRPFQAAFSDKFCTDEARVAEGEWMASFGSQKARHSGTFMGIKPSGKEIEIRYMDFWHVKDGKIVNNWVMVDFPHVLMQLGVDVFNGKGWDTYDENYDCKNEKA